MVNPICKEGTCLHLGLKTFKWDINMIIDQLFKMKVGNKLSVIFQPNQICSFSLLKWCILQDSKTECQVLRAVSKGTCKSLGLMTILSIRRKEGTCSKISRHKSWTAHLINSRFKNIKEGRLETTTLLQREAKNWHQIKFRTKIQFIQRF